MSLPSSADELLVVPAASAPAPRRPWIAPIIEALPRLTELTLASPIGGGGGIGGGGSTVFGLLLAAGLLVGVGACSDEIIRPSTPVGTRPLVSSQALSCRADVRAGTIDCAAPAAAPGQVIIGGQGIHVGLRSSNTSYNGTSHIFSADVSVQNESALPMGTQDGTTLSSGVSVFFFTQPTGDVGTVTVANPTGTNTFTASNQPYFLYNQVLASQAVSSTQTWQFQLDPSTTSFTFQVEVSADMPAVSAIRRWVEEPGMNPVNWEGISGFGSDGLAVFGQFGEVYVRDSGVWRARNDPLGDGANGPVVAVGPNDLTTFTSSFNTRHWDGISWRAIESLSGGPGSGGLVSFIGGSGKSGACAFGFHQNCFNGSAWTNVAVTGSPHVTASTVIAGNIVVLTTGGVVWSRDSNSGTWTQIGGGGSGQTLSPGIIFGTSTSNIWTLSNQNNADPVIRHWDGSSWTTQADPSGQDNNTGTPEGGVAFSSTDAYVVRADLVGHGHVWHWDGTNWTEVRTAAYNYSGIWARGTDDFYVAEDGGRVEHDSAGTWTLTLGNTEAGRAVWQKNSSDIYLGTNSNGHVLHYDGATWDTVATLGGSISSLWGSGDSDVWASRNSNVVWHYDGTGWGSAAIGLMSFTIFAAGGSGPSDVWAVGSLGQILHYNGSTWSTSEDLETLTANDLEAVWALNPNFAVAVGVGGTIAMWKSGSWSLATSGTSATLRSVWGTDTSNVWAVSDGGAIVHYDGTTWSTQSSGTGQNLHGVWAASADEAYIVGENRTALMYNGVSWSPVSVQSAVTGAGFYALSGKAGGQVIVAGDRILRGIR